MSFWNDAVPSRLTLVLGINTVRMLRAGYFAFALVVELVDTLS